ncbi:MAG: outer membrane beta-barrel protein [Opitutae bacterium]|nr:outer membrane beta-barrel protein [Opitutae bacterium]
MTCKTCFSPVFAVLFSITAGQASPMMALGDNGSIIARLGGAIQYQDNIFLDNANERSDTIVVFSPGVELNLGGSTSNAHTNVVYIHDFVHYFETDSLDRDNIRVAVKGHSKWPKARINYSMSFREHSQNDASNNVVGDIARRDRYHGVIRSEWEMSAKSSLAASLGMDKVDYEAANLQDRQSYNIPLDYFWEYSPKLDMSVGYRFRHTSFSRDYNFPAAIGRDEPKDLSTYKDHFLNVGVRGQVGPKMSGEIKVGIQNRESNTSGRVLQDMFALDGQVVWAATEKTAGTLRISRDFRSDAFGASIESSELSLSARTRFNEEYSGFATIRYAEDLYFTGREDEAIFGQVGLTYTPSVHSAISLAYVVYNNNSNFKSADFDSRLVNLSGKLRY